MAGQYADIAHVVHEPLGGQYHAKELLRAHSKDYTHIQTNPRIVQHMEEIESIVKEKWYIETGWHRPSLASRTVSDFHRCIGEVLDVAEDWIENSFTDRTRLRRPPAESVESRQRHACEDHRL